MRRVKSNSEKETSVQTIQTSLNLIYNKVVFSSKKKPPEDQIKSAHAKLIRDEANRDKDYHLENDFFAKLRRTEQKQSIAKKTDLV